jgi:HK97 family phage major capsid protein
MANPVGNRIKPRRDIQSIQVEEPTSFRGFLKAVAATGDTNPYVQRKGRYTLEKVYKTEYQSGPLQTRKSTMGENTGSEGGYLLPTDYTTGLMKALVEKSFFYPRCTKFEMTTEEERCPLPAITTPTTTGQSPFFGGMNFGWGSSQHNTLETEPAFGQLQLNAWDLLGYAYVSNQWLWDTGEEGEKATIELFGDCARWQIEYAFFQGTGSDGLMPLGILNNAGGSYFQTRLVPGKIVTNDIADMVIKLLPLSWETAIWATSPSCLGQITKFENFFINENYYGEVTDGAFVGILEGRPLFVTDKLPHLGTTGDLVFFDPKRYIVGMRQDVLVDSSSHVLFRTNQTVFRVWLRCDGKPQVSAQITLPDMSTIVSPYIVLQ